MPRGTNKRTSRKVAKVASKLLRTKRTPRKVKIVAASALSQARAKPKKGKK